MRDILVVAFLLIFLMLIGFFLGRYSVYCDGSNDGKNNHYAQKDTIMIENTDTIRDTIYVSVPDQNAYNIGYFDGNFDAQNGNIIGVDND